MIIQRSMPARVHALVWSCLFSLVAGSCHRPVEEAVRVGVIAPLSGALAESVGGPQVRAAQLAVEHALARGGLEARGRKYRVELLIEDAMGRREVAVRAARKLINQDNVVALLGPALSRSALGVAVVAENRRTPMISPTSTHSELTSGRQFVFRTTFTDDLQARALARFAWNDLRARKAGILFDATSAHNHRVAEIFQDFFSGLGGRIVASEPYSSGARDFRSSLARVGAAQPDVLLLPNFIDDVPAQVRQARELGLTSIFLGSDAWDGMAFPDQAVFEGSFYTDDWHPEVPELATAESRAFVQAHIQVHNQTPNTVAGLSYDAMSLLLTAIEGALEANSTLDGEAIRHQLARIEGYPGVTGTLSFHGSGDPLKGVSIFEIKARRVVFRRWIEP